MAFGGAVLGNEVIDGQVEEVVECEDEVQNC